jgi:poly(hydroxyalkanoate) depolymerase family esterase
MRQRPFCAGSFPAPRLPQVRLNSRQMHVWARPSLCDSPLSTWRRRQREQTVLGRHRSSMSCSSAFLAECGRRRSLSNLAGSSTLPGNWAPRASCTGSCAHLSLLPDGAQFEERAYAGDAGSRTYKLYVPSGYDKRAVPLVVMLHGCTQSPDDFAIGTRMNELAEEQTFLVAYPAQSRAANVSKCWNWFNEGHQQRNRGEPSLIAGITREIMSNFAVESRRVFIAGLSAGGAAAAIMGSSYPDLFAAVGVHSGLACGAATNTPSAFAAMRRGGAAGRLAGRGSKNTVPTIVFHGDRDMTVNAVNGDQVIAQSKAAADLRTTVSRGEAPDGLRYTRCVHMDENGRTILEQWVLHGAGHAWSGGSSAGSYTDPRGPNASREMVRFFLQSQGT